MQIYTQACGVVLLSILFVLFTMKRSKLFLDTEKYFIATLVASLMANVTDIVCQYALSREEVNLILSNVVCKLYQIFLLMVLLCTMLYVSRDIYHNIKRFVLRSWYYVAIFIVACILIVVLPEDMNTESGKLYARGPAVNATYSMALFFTCAVLVRVNVFRKSMNADRRSAINLWMVLWIIAAGLEYLFPSLLITSFASSVGVMIVYIKLENPAMNQDRQSNLYNQTALMEYVNQLYGLNKSFSMIVMVPLGYGDNRYNHAINMKQIPEIFKAGKGLIFRKTEDEIAIIFNSYEEAAAWGENYIKRNIDSNDEDIININNSMWISIPDSRWFADSDELMYFIKYAITNKQLNVELRNKKFIRITEDMVLIMRKEKQVELMLDDALENNRVEVFYQPIYSTEKHKFTSAEALVRLKNTDGGIVYPGVFIEIAERTGKIIELGAEVFRQVCSFIRDENIIQYGIEYVEVNLSVTQCADAKLADVYIGTMKEYGINPKCINLEITESASLKSKEILLDNMKRLIDFGVNFSLDDFGTGQSNLNYIVDMPVDIVKFDRGMINAYFDNFKAKYVMDAAMHMIHGMGLKIVSEGIETDAQFDKMKDLGISYIQGFYFSKPLEKNEFIKYIKEHNEVDNNVQ